MARPIAFKPASFDPKVDLLRKLEQAPEKHAEALLLAYDILEAAREEGLLDLLHGAIGARDTIVDTLSKFAATPEGVTGVRNLLTAAKILTELDPALLDQLSRVVGPATDAHQQEKTPPSLWQIFKRTTSEDGRRGLSFMTLLLTSLGRSLKSRPGH